MKIAYRRYSGKAFLEGDKVTSKRGAWLEKRIAFIKLLQSRGHEVVVLHDDSHLDEDFEVMFVEFGSTNMQFYGDDITLTGKYMQKAKKTILLCDDPELFPKELFTTAWVNATDAKACTVHFKHKCESFPFYGLQPVQDFASEHNGKIVYYGGTSQGREERLNKYRALLPLPVEVYGKEKEYTTMKPKDPPSQEERSSFYRQFAYCLGMNDNKHKKLGWNTGRIFHALASGIPVLHENMWKEELKEDRKTLWYAQSLIFDIAHQQCLDKLNEHGL